MRNAEREKVQVGRTITVSRYLCAMGQTQTVTGVVTSIDDKQFIVNDDKGGIFNFDFRRTKFIKLETST